MPLSKLPSKGAILWLPPRDKIAKHSLYSGGDSPPELAHDHPVVVLSTDDEDGLAFAVILKVTSLRQTALNDKPKHMRAKHLPIYPSKPHTDSMKLLFLAHGRKLRRLSYVQLKPAYKVGIASLRHPQEGRNLVLSPTSYRELVEASGLNLDSLVGRGGVSRNMPSRPLPGCGYGTMGQASEPRPLVPSGRNVLPPQPVPIYVGQPVQQPRVPIPAHSAVAPSGTAILPEYYTSGRRTPWRRDWNSARKYLKRFCLILRLLIWTAIFLSLCYGIYVAGPAVVGYAEMSWHYLASLVEKLIRMIRGWISF